MAITVPYWQCHIPDLLNPSNPRRLGLRSERQWCREILSPRHSLFLTGRTGELLDGVEGNKYEKNASNLNQTISNPWMFDDVWWFLHVFRVPIQFFGCSEAKEIKHEATSSFPGIEEIDVLEFIRSKWDRAEEWMAGTWNTYQNRTLAHTMLPSVR
jgi:hypothetical protein